MKLISQTDHSVIVEISSLELELMKAGLGKELKHRSKVWDKLSPIYPEELVYHAIMRDTSGELLLDITRILKAYRGC